MMKKILFLIVVMLCIISILHEEFLDFGLNGFLLSLRRNWMAGLIMAIKND
jgi:hypothetical protein